MGDPELSIGGHGYQNFASSSGSGTESKGTRQGKSLTRALIIFAPEL